MQKDSDYKKLKQLKKNYTIIVYSGLLLSILFIAICYLIFEKPINGYLAILGFLIINAIFIFVIAKADENKFFKLYDELIVKKVLDKNFENVSIQFEKENNHKINFVNIFTEKVITTSNYVKCDYKDIPLEIIETQVKELREHWNDERHSTSYVQIFNGLVYCYKIKTNNKNNINIVSKYYLKGKDNIKNIPYTDYKKTSIYDNSYKEVKSYSEIPLSKINLENEQYKDWFSVHADCTINEKNLCDGVLNLLLELRKQVGEKIFILIQEDMLYIGINNYYNLYKNDVLSKKKSFDDEIQKLSEHIDLIKQLIDTIQKDIKNLIEA